MTTMLPIHPTAMFRAMVLGPLATRESFEHGELKVMTEALAKLHYDIPNSSNTKIDSKTIERWYYLWRKGGIEALTPKVRNDLGQSKLSDAVQKAIIELKKDNPKRSISSLKMLLEEQGIAKKGEVSRSSIHRLLKQHKLNRPPKSESTIERRSYVAPHTGSLWVGDVMHGPKLKLAEGVRKTFLVSIMDDSSRLLPHSEFCLAEKALDIEGVLKQAIIKRGMPTKLIVDNGAAYRSLSLQGICIRLGIRLIYSRPYEPQSKGKLERFHRTFRQQFLSELQPEKITRLADLNARLWAWIDQCYHTRVHQSLEGLSPLACYQRDLAHVHPIKMSAKKFDDIFNHRILRKVRKDGTVSYNSQRYEVPFELSGQKVMLVVDPHRELPLNVESPEGEYLGAVTPLDYQANANRTRHRPKPESVDHPSDLSNNQYSHVERCLEKKSSALAPMTESQAPSKKSKLKPDSF